MGIYNDQVKKFTSHLKPEVVEKLSEGERQRIPMYLVLAANWGAGDALAGSLLGTHPKLVATMTQLVKELGGPELFPAFTAGSWWVMNLHALADFFLDSKGAKALKEGALTGKGV